MTTGRITRRLTALAAACACTWAGAAVVTSGPAPAGPVVLTGSSSNNANPGCNGKHNVTCNGGGTDTGGGNGSTKEFGVTVGTVSGLWPGRTVSLPVTYTNPHGFAIHVDTLTVTASTPEAAAAAGCTGAHLAVPDGTASLSPVVEVPARAATNSGIEVGLRHSAPDACKNVTFTVTVTATAVKR